MISQENQLTMFSDSSSTTEDPNAVLDSYATITRNRPARKKTFREFFLALDFETNFDLDSNEKDSLFDFEEDSTENKANRNRKKILDTNLTKDFINLLREEDFEFGYKTRSEAVLREQLKINELATRNWLNETFIKYFKDQTVIIGLMRILCRFEPKEIFPQGQTMAIAALSHQNNEIKELGIRAFESWGSHDSLEILMTINVEANWLNDYLQEVIKDLQE
jgi:hypothetical protein